MTRFSYFLLAFACLLLQPVGAQDGGDAEIEIGDGCGGAPSDRDTPQDKTKKFGGDEGPRDDVDAPKVKHVTQEAINKAIADGVKWLKKHHEKGFWGPVRANRKYGETEPSGNYVRDELGPTAWAVYTLAKCDVKKSDSDLKRGLNYILAETEFVFDTDGSGKAQYGGREKLQKSSRKTPRTLTTYENAAIILMIEAVYERSAKLTGKHKKRRLYTDNARKPPSGSKIPKKVWLFMHERIEFLTIGRRRGGGGRSKGKGVWTDGLQTKKGPNRGGWRYGPGGDGDLSATQFALLALRAASQAGYPVEKVAKDTWRDAANYVMKCQRPDGGFTYQVSSGKPTGSMTGCGVGCLLICKEQMELARSRDPDAHAPSSKIDDAIRKGMDWLDKNFVANQNPGGKHHYYYLYGVERVGDLAGRKEFNGKDWYVRGAEFLLNNQHADGKWVDATEGFPPRDVISTTLALLFLKRATPPAVTFTGD